ncbi:hypothetical protein MYSTI_02089 [Myxococcus stipitatus DSM 14675]|uniref:Beta-lactamase n=2 Tax=Myxococcus stipitatus TaxID=83455 RepID=L7U5Q8_MYXSD|nr:hypothetical protein MYSTI_02089 [Myxococcus stipitatus DSM 14675]
MFVLGLLGGGVACKAPLTPEEDRGRAVEWVRTHSSEPVREECPADRVPEKETKLGDFKTHCDGRLAWCARQCSDGDDATACYSLAYGFMVKDTHVALMEPLYRRSCVLGAMRGCTLWAGALAYLHGSSDEEKVCLARTYEKTCARGEPMGCAVHGFDLMIGRHAPPDLKKAREVLERVCKATSADDPACESARDSLAALTSLERNPGTTTPPPATRPRPGGP